MKQPTIAKPQLDISQALAFATGTPQIEKEGKDKGSSKKTAHRASKQANNTRIFFAPEGDKRLTINLNAELHKKLKIAAIEQEITAGEIIEKLLEKYL
jgi:hypothetical protein